jgi:hypothetical protein
MTILEKPLLELLIQTLCDPSPSGQLDGAYLFAQTADNQSSVFETGLHLLKQGRVRQLLLSGSGPLSGYPGFPAWQQELIGLGLDQANIRRVPATSEMMLHTLIEAESLVRYARAQGLTRLFVVSAPFHQLRAFMTTVKVALREFPELEIYNKVGAALPWHEVVSHSQGTLQLKRRELIQAELERIEKYQNQGNLASVAEASRYLEWRNHLFNRQG